LPEDVEARRRRGDAEENGRWFVPETIEGRRRRTEIAELVRTARRAVKAPTVDEETLRGGWKGSATTPSFEVVSTSAPTEAARVAVELEVSRALASSLFGER